MKITSVVPLTCDSGIAGREWLFLKVTTDEGIVGWGEGCDWQAAPALAEAIRLVGAEVIGQDPRRIDFISRRLRDAGRAGVPEAMKVIAALDLALYDIKGKWLGVPAYELIGGLYRDRIPLYWSEFANRTVDGRLALVDEVERAGFRALKTTLLIRGLESGHRPSLGGAIDRGRINAAVDFVGALRQRCGPDMGILFDVGQDYRMGGIVQLARALEPFDLYWLEAEGFDPDALLAARQQTRTRICHGAALIGRQAFRPFLERHVTDVVAIEMLSNGLSEARRIADLAAHYDAMFSPHNTMSPLATLINAHLCAVMPNCEILEIGMDDVPWKWQLVDHPPRIEGGELIVPDRPGWGGDVVEEEVARHPLRAHEAPRSERQGHAGPGRG
jgi:galactonate dehydratase